MTIMHGPGFISLLTCEAILMFLQCNMSPGFKASCRHCAEVKDNIITPCRQVRLQHIVVFLYIGDVISHGDGRTTINCTITLPSQAFFALKGHILLHFCGGLVVIMKSHWNLYVWPLGNILFTFGICCSAQLQARMGGVYLLYLK